MKRRFSLKGYSKGTYNSKYFFSIKDIDFNAEILNYDHFLLQEFFTANLEIKSKIEKAYRRAYGSLSLAYLKRKYDSWVKGDYHLTDLMRERIVLMTFNNLSDEAKFKLGVYEFMSSIKANVKSFQIRQNYNFKYKRRINRQADLIEMFKSEILRIDGYKEKTSKYSVLNKEEKFEALEISKYIMRLKLNVFMKLIESDFELFSGYLELFSKLGVSAYYFIATYNVDIDILEISINDLRFSFGTMSELSIETKYRPYADKFLAYEMIEIQNQKNKAVFKSKLSQKEIDSFILKYKELLTGKYEVEMKSDFESECGVLKLSTKVVPYVTIKNAIILSWTKIFSFVVAIAVVLIFFMSIELTFVKGFIGFVLILLAINLLIFEISELKSFREKYKEF